MTEVAGVALVAVVAALIGLGIGRVIASRVGRLADSGDDEHDQPDSA
jgi:hypothetical protein